MNATNARRRATRKIKKGASSSLQFAIPEDCIRLRYSDTLSAGSRDQFGPGRSPPKTSTTVLYVAGHSIPTQQQHHRGSLAIGPPVLTSVLTRRSCIYPLKRHTMLCVSVCMGCLASYLHSGYPADPLLPLLLKGLARSLYLCAHLGLTAEQSRRCFLCTNVSGGIVRSLETLREVDKCKLHTRE